MALRTGEIATCVQKALERAGINATVDDVHVVVWREQMGSGTAPVPHQARMTVNVYGFEPSSADVLEIGRATSRESETGDTTPQQKKV